MKIGRYIHGEANCSAKLTNKEVAQIKDLRNRFTFTELGKLYGVSRTTIKYILEGRMRKVV